MAFWKKKTPQDLRRKRLAEIERQRIGQHEHLDYHYAMVAMQDEQIARLKEEIAADEPPVVGVLQQTADENSVFTNRKSCADGMRAFGTALRKLRGDLTEPANG